MKVMTEVRTATSSAPGDTGVIDNAVNHALERIAGIVARYLRWGSVSIEQPAAMVHALRLYQELETRAASRQLTLLEEYIYEAAQLIVDEFEMAFERDEGRRQRLPLTLEVVELLRELDRAGAKLPEATTRNQA